MFIMKYYVAMEMSKLPLYTRLKDSVKRLEYIHGLTVKASKTFPTFISDLFFEDSGWEAGLWFVGNILSSRVMVS